MYENPRFRPSDRDFSGEGLVVPEPPEGMPALMEPPVMGWSLSSPEPEPERVLLASQSGDLAVGPAPARELRLVGGALIYTGSTYLRGSWPLMTLELFDDGIGVGFRWGGPGWPRVRFLWGEITDVRLAERSVSWRDDAGRLFRFVSMTAAALDALGPFFSKHEVTYRVVTATWTECFRLRKSSV